MNPWIIEAVGYCAAAVNVFVYISNTMIPLRIAAIVANGLFASYFYLKGVYPLFLVNACLLPLNVWRLNQMQQLIGAVRAASASDFNFEWLRPYMKPLRISAGLTLYRKGDLAEDAFVIVRGTILLPEPGVRLEAGALFGEMGLFTDENRRTASAVAADDVELLCVRYADLLQLAAQNPQFGLYLMRLMVRRMQHNVELARTGKA
jgi:CRP/FNR family cyclic AMP-dependent transcriptional regulator